MEQHANEVVAKTKHTTFPFSKLPAELRSMVLSHAVVEEAMVPLKNPRLQICSPRHKIHAKRCCGHCRGAGIVVDCDLNCRCINMESYSTSCRCVSLSDGIFFVSQEARAEALRVYWSKNKFILHKHIDFGLGHTLRSVPKPHFKMIRHLVIDTPSYLEGPTFSDTPYPVIRAGNPHWGSVLRYLERHGGQKLQVEIRSSCKTKRKHDFDNFLDSWWMDPLMNREVERQAGLFRNLVLGLRLRVKALISETETTTVLVDHDPFKKDKSTARS
jgi:hypothetical protein